MPLVVAIVVIVVLLFVLWVAFVKDPGPGPADVAVAYEAAWDRLDFEVLYDLSGEELRDNMPRASFVAAKRGAHSAPHDHRLGVDIEVEEVVEANRTAVVVTRVTTSDGASVRNNVLLEQRSAGWQVVAYSLRG